MAEVEMGGDTLVLWLDPGTASTLDSPVLAEGRDVGATGVFVPVVDGQELTFERTDAGFVDDQTGSRWNMLGDALDGPLAGRPGTGGPCGQFWFAWGAFQPDTRIVP